MKNISVRDLLMISIKDQLIALGADGLASNDPNEPCGCHRDDLRPCDSDCFLDCVFGVETRDADEVGIEPIDFTGKKDLAATFDGLTAAEVKRLENLAETQARKLVKFEALARRRRRQVDRLRAKNARLLEALDRIERTWYAMKRAEFSDSPDVRIKDGAGGRE